MRGDVCDVCDECDECDDLPYRLSKAVPSLETSG